jgi:ankyrin repeat protein
MKNLFFTTVACVTLSSSLQAMDRARVSVAELQSYFYETQASPQFAEIVESGRSCFVDINNKAIDLDHALYNNKPLDNNGTTPLDVAVQTRSGNWLKFLFSSEYPAYHEVKGFFEHVQEANKNKTTIDFVSLESYNKVISQPLDEAGNTALHLAVAANNPQLVQDLCRAGANPNKKNIALDLPLTLAIRGPLKREVFDILIEYINPNETSSLGNLFGHLLAYYRDENATYALEKLVQKGMNVSENAVYGDSPLHGAAWICNAPMIKKFKKLGAHINLQNYYGRTPFHAAAMSGDKATIDALLEFENIDTSLTDKDGKKPSDVAANAWVAEYLRNRSL